MDCLHTLPPQAPRSIEIGTTPFWIGSGREVHHRVHHPGVRDRHLGLMERADGYWTVRGDGDALVNGKSMGDGVLLRPGDVIELAKGCAFRFNEAIVAPAPPAAQPAAKPPRRRKPSRLRVSFRVPVRSIVITTIVALLLGAAGFAFWLGSRAGDGAVDALTLDQSIILDSLLRDAYDHIERGTALLEVGASQVALGEFADGVNVLQVNPLRSHPAVAERIVALESAIAAIYQEHRVAVPSAYASARQRGGIAAAGLTASLSREEFGLRFGEVDGAFRRRFGDSLVVTGRDHAEHVSLYGSGSALDIRSKDLRPEQVQFAVGEFLRVGVRVKDFSRDAILRAQIEAAMKAGLPDRAGTGLHLHVDRFAGRRDRWTAQ